MNPDSPETKAAVWVALVFFLGLCLGALGGYAFAHRSYAASASSPAQLSDVERRAQKMAELTQLLGLSSDQQQKIDVVMADVQGKMRAIRQESEPQLDQVRHAGRDRIRTVLTPEQLPKFEEFIAKLDAARKRQTH